MEEYLSKEELLMLSVSVAPAVRHMNEPEWQLEVGAFLLDDFVGFLPNLERKFPKRIMNRVEGFIDFVKQQ